MDTYLDSINFQNSFVDNLPGDPIRQNYIRTVFKACYSLVDPEPVSDPELVEYSDEVGSLLGLARADKNHPSVQIMAGNLVTGSMKPFAACYGGHQFGHWAGQLGDGRAITLGDIVNDSGARFEIQLKGSGETPYSRRGDGRAVFRSSLREFLCSEAMAHLGIPTTRALSLVGTKEMVMRDMFYDGNAKPEPGAIVSRVAPSFLRFGSFEILADRQDNAILLNLLDYLIAYHFPEFGKGQDAYARWFLEICKRTALLMVDWMRVGFVHGVMNTDNMSALGLTLDYGPYGWLEDFDPAWTPNTTDFSTRRYAYGKQPEIAYWNLTCLASSLLPVLDKKVLEEGLATYTPTFNQGYHQAFAHKLGFLQLDGEEDQSLLRELLSLLAAVETDFTLFFRCLTDFSVHGDIKEDELLSAFSPAYYDDKFKQQSYRERMMGWIEKYRKKTLQEGVSPKNRRELMLKSNPGFVLRNYLVQEAIDLASTGEYKRISELFDALKDPYVESPDPAFSQRRPEWARYKPGCSALSCSS
ncbi:MAG: YdiU family protein [Candidatus Cloacimonetes bacterium]|nr:YdiU family protein [Candidatus Cloacimonadota bacterium]